jgi:hypothetical protein
LQRIIRRGVKEIEKDGSLDSDEDACYSRASRHRPYYERVEQEQARQWVKSTAHRRAALALQRSRRDDSKSRELEQEFERFISDPDLFRRGKEDFFTFHQRKIGRIKEPSGKTKNPSFFPSGSVNHPTISTAKSEYITSFDEDFKADSKSKPSSKSSSLQTTPSVVVAQSNSTSSSALNNKYEVQHAAALEADKEGGDAYLRIRLNGEILEKPLKAHLTSEYVSPDRGTHKRYCRLCAPSQLEGAIFGRKGVEGMNSDSEPEESLPSNRRKKKKQQAKPITLAQQESILHVPWFRELSPSYLQGKRGNDSNARVKASASDSSATKAPKATPVKNVVNTPSPVQTPSVSTSSGGILGKFSKLASMLGSGFLGSSSPSVKDEKTENTTKPSRAAKVVAAEAINSSKRSRSDSVASSQSNSSKAAASSKKRKSDEEYRDLETAFDDGDASNAELDEGGYDAAISEEFYSAFVDQKASINEHPDSIVVAAREAANPKRKKLLLSAVLANPQSMGTLTGSSGGVVAPGLGNPLGATISVAFLNHSNHASLAISHANNIVNASLNLTDSWNLEKWLIRKRLHHNELFESDDVNPEIPPVATEFNASVVPYAPLLIQLCEEYRTKRCSKGVGLPGCLLGSASISMMQSPSESTSADGSAESFASSPSSSPKAPSSAIKSKGARGRSGRSPVHYTPSSSKSAAPAAQVAEALLRGGGTLPPTLITSIAAFTSNANDLHASTPQSKSLNGPESSDSQSYPSLPSSFNPLQLGAMADVRDPEGNWWLAQVVDVQMSSEDAHSDDDDLGEYTSERDESSNKSYDGNRSANSTPKRQPPPKAFPRLMIHYLGWPEDYDEWIVSPPTAVVDHYNEMLSSKATRDQWKSKNIGSNASIALRKALDAARIAPPMTRSELLSTACTVCSNKKSGALIYCDFEGCGRAYHTSCHRPALDRVPNARFVCMHHKTEK